MTVIPVSELTRHELQHLGTNLVAAVRQDRDEIKAINRSLAALGEELDIETQQAILSEQVAD